ncbi:MAG TPA: hypothetical protein VHW02_02545 [Rhizomicrobium sp.]|nr:hypothetical protein [Rhizomicrobium sp.]
MRWLWCWLVLVSAILPASAAPVQVSLGQSIVALNGPWKFHTGDNPRWAAPDFNDSSWENFDLTPPPGSHDGDVGLKNYVSGWGAHGHRGYSGYAWYRMTIRVSDAKDEPLWLAGPAAVDTSYQVYFNGHLIGGIGDFSRGAPTVISIQPRMFALPRTFWKVDGGKLAGVLAFRIANLKGAAAADGGGIHIAPLLGSENSVSEHYQLQWLQTFEGYVVDAAEPIVFVILAIMALSLWPFDPKNSLYAWMAAGLILMGVARANQPFYFWGQSENIVEFVWFRLVVVDALAYGAWVMAWRAAFGLRHARWIAAACAVLTIAYMIARVCSVSLVAPLSKDVLAGFSTILQGVHFGFLALFLYLAVRGLLLRERGAWLGVLSLLCLAAGLFAQEVSMLGIPGIWFPFGVGVSRTQYIYPVFAIALFAYLLDRLWSFAPRKASSLSSPVYGGGGLAERSEDKSEGATPVPPPPLPSRSAHSAPPP